MLLLFAKFGNADKRNKAKKETLAPGDPASPTAKNRSGVFTYKSQYKLVVVYLFYSVRMSGVGLDTDTCIYLVEHGSVDLLLAVYREISGPRIGHQQ